MAETERVSEADGMDLDAADRASGLVKKASAVAERASQRMERISTCGGTIGHHLLRARSPKTSIFGGGQKVNKMTVFRQSRNPAFETRQTLGRRHITT